MSTMQELPMNTTTHHSRLRVATAAFAVTIATVLLTAPLQLSPVGDPPASPTSMHNVKHA